MALEDVSKRVVLKVIRADEQAREFKESTARQE